MNKEKLATTPIQQSVAEEVAELTLYLANRAETLASVLFAKLEPVMFSERPSDTGVSEKDKEYPPYFNELRNKLYRIGNVLSNIEDAISRTAL